MTVVMASLRYRVMINPKTHTHAHIYIYPNNFLYINYISVKPIILLIHFLLKTRIRRQEEENLTDELEDQWHPDRGQS